MGVESPTAQDLEETTEEEFRVLWWILKRYDNGIVMETYRVMFHIAKIHDLDCFWRLYARQPLKLSEIACRLEQIWAISENLV